MIDVGFDQPLYILPFDHRVSFVVPGFVGFAVGGRRSGTPSSAGATAG